MARATAIVVIAVAADAGCTIHPTDVPPLTGPSTFATSINIAATPTVLNRGDIPPSTSVITVTVYDANGKPWSPPLKPLELRVDVYVGCDPSPAVPGPDLPCGKGSINNTFGTLSAQTISIVNGTDSKANTVYYTAPALPASPTVPPEETVSIIAMPKNDSSGDYDPSRRVRTDIRLVPQGVFSPPALVPTPKFTFAPSTPAANSSVQFDASGSCAGPLDSSSKCPSTSGTITAYSWNFGDGFGTGQVVSHAFTSQQSFSVILRVTNDSGVSASLTQVVPVGAGNLPTPSFVFSPSTDLAVGQTVFFNAVASQAGAGHTIVQYTWNFGDGNTGSSATPTHAFQSAGTFNVTLTVADETGQKATTSPQLVKVGTGSASGSGATASFTFTVGPTTWVNFDATKSKPLTGTITTYTWTYGDNSQDTGSLLSKPVHFYSAAGPYPVTLVVVDSGGNSASTSQTVTVP